jgi:protein TonB
MRNLTLAAVCALAVSACATNASNNRPQSMVAPIEQKEQALPASSGLNYDSPSRVQPIYPGFDSVYGIQGTVILMALVMPDGRVTSIRVEKSAGDRQLDRAAINAVRQWRFIAERKNGVAVEGYARIPVNFSVEVPSLPDNWPANYAHPRSVLDTDPIPYPSVDDALLAVSTAAGEPIAINTSSEAQTYIIRDSKGSVHEWWIFTDMDTAYATALRYVFTYSGTPSTPEVKVSALCRSGVSFCDSRASWLLRGPVFARGAQPTAASTP